MSNWLKSVIGDGVTLESVILRDIISFLIHMEYLFFFLGM